MSGNGVPIETTADLVGHAGIAVTENVYRHQLKPIITKGAKTMNTIFTEQVRVTVALRLAPPTFQDRKGPRIVSGALSDLLSHWWAILVRTSDLFGVKQSE
jgi:hypothetical protein